MYRSVRMDTRRLGIPNCIGCLRSVVFSQYYEKVLYLLPCCQSVVRGSKCHDGTEITIQVGLPTFAIACADGAEPETIARD